MRGKKLGESMMNEIKSLGNPVKLDVVARNTSAISFYHKQGFVEVGGKTLGKDNIKVTTMMWGDK